MDLLRDHFDILQNIEAVTIAFCAENPSIKDAHVLTVYEKLAGLFDRRKRKLPDLPVSLPPTQMELYLSLKALCESRILGDPNEMPEAYNVAPGVMVQCLKKLIGSVKRWSKEGGAKGYIQFVSGMLKG